MSGATALSERFGVVTVERTPKRLSKETRELAARFLSGEFGRELRRAGFEMGDEELEGLSPDRRYAETVMRIAETAPLRVLPGEKLVGAAPLLEATHHRTPGIDVGSTSHTTAGFGRVMEEGYRGLRRRVGERLERGDLDEKGRVQSV
jgi:formate C-acetyltransferase